MPGDGLRSFALSRHVVFYLHTDDAVEIVRILDGRRDIELLLEEPEP